MSKHEKVQTLAREYTGKALDEDEVRQALRESGLSASNENVGLFRRFQETHEPQETA